MNMMMHYNSMECKANNLIALIFSANVRTHKLAIIPTRHTELMVQNQCPSEGGQNAS